jgi:hypothetical protein
MKLNTLTLAIVLAAGTLTTSSVARADHHQTGQKPAMDMKMQMANTSGTFKGIEVNGGTSVS